MKTLILAFMTLLLLAAFGFAGDSTQVDKEKVEQAEKPAKQAEKAVNDDKATEKTEKKADEAPEMITTESGLRYQDLVVGKGVEAVNNMPVVCHYTIWLADSTGLVKEKKIQSSKDSGKEFHCRIGHKLIQGWNEGMIGMKEGGSRRLYVPWVLGYGSQGMGSMIPPKSNLVFELDFLRQESGQDQ